MKLSTLTLASLALAAASSFASAVTLNLDSYTSTAAFPSDTRLNGSATNSPVSVDGTNTTVKLVSTNGIDGNEKVAPFFSAGTNAAIGTLGDLGRGFLTADWMLESMGANSQAHDIAAFRLLVDGPIAGTFAEIIWESSYQSPIPTFTAGVGYNDYSIGSGKFYARYLSQSYGEGSNGALNPLTLAQIASGAALTTSPTNPIFTDSTNVYGLQVSVGSGAGDYSAYVGDINASFVAVPEPTTLAALAGATVLGLRRRRA